MKKRMRRSWPSRGRARRDGGRPRRGPTPVAEPFAIGGLQLENRLVQAPLAGIANWAFRRQSRRHGAGLAVSEMIASFGIRYANRKTLGMLTIVADEHPVGRPGLRRRRRRDGRGRAGGRGRPAPTWSTSTWAARSRRSARPARAPRCSPTRTPPRAIVEAMVRAVDIPVTVKMRRGLTPDQAAPGRDRPALRGGRRRRALRAPARRGRGVRRHRRPPHHGRGRRRGVRAGHRQRRHRRRPTTPGGCWRTPGCAAVAVGRARARQPVGLRRHPRAARRGPRPTLTRWSTRSPRFAADARLALGDGARRAGTCASSIPGTSPGTPVRPAELDGAAHRSRPSDGGPRRGCATLAAAPAAA